MNSKDAQFMESRTFSVDEVGRWFGVPPHLLGLTEKSTSWGQGIAEQNRGLARYTLKSLDTAHRAAPLPAGHEPAPHGAVRLHRLHRAVPRGQREPDHRPGQRRADHPERRPGPAQPGPRVEGGDVLRIPAGAANPAAGHRPDR
jgi:hypothetical protein